MSAIIIYLTCRDHQEAEIIAKALVEEQLVACANIFAPHMSIYRWEGKIEQGQEVAVMFKTQSKFFKKAKERIVSLHSYECPCVVSWPIKKGHGPFLQWVTDQTDR